MINEQYYYTFLLCLENLECFFNKMSHFWLTTFQVPIGQTWLVATVLGSDDLKKFLKEK